MLHPLAALLAGAAVLGVPAAAAAAPALNPLKPCYVSVSVDTETGDYVTEDVMLAGGGFTPGSQVTITIDDTTAATNVPIDAAGNLPERSTIAAPFHEIGERLFTVTVTDQQDPALTASVQSMVSQLTFTMRPRRASFRQRVTFAGRGFTDLAKPVYAHYVLGRKLRKTVMVTETPEGPCGTFAVKRRQFPFRPKVGRWIVQLDQQKRYSRNPASVFVTRELFVKRALRKGR